MRPGKANEELVLEETKEASTGVEGKKLKVGGITRRFPAGQWQALHGLTVVGLSV